MDLRFELDNHVGRLARETAACYRSLFDPPLALRAQAILWRLTVNDLMSITDLSRAMSVSKSEVKKHTDYLLAEGLVVTTRAPRGSEPLRLHPERLAEVHAWKSKVLYTIKDAYASLEESEQKTLNELTLRVLTHVRTIVSSAPERAEPDPSSSTKTSSQREQQAADEEGLERPSVAEMPDVFCAAPVKVTVEFVAAASAGRTRK